RLLMMVSVCYCRRWRRTVCGCHACGNDAFCAVARFLGLPAKWTKPYSPAVRAEQALLFRRFQLECKIRVMSFPACVSVRGGVRVHEGESGEAPGLQQQQEPQRELLLQEFHRV